MEFPNLFCDESLEPIDPIDLSCEEVIDDAAGEHEEVLEDKDRVLKPLPILNRPTFAVHPEISQWEEDNFFEMKLCNETEDHEKVGIIPDPSARKMMVEHVFQLGEKLKVHKDNVYIAVQLIDKLLFAGPVREKIAQSIGCLLIAIKLNETEEQMKNFKLHFKYSDVKKRIASAEMAVLLKITFNIGRWVRATPFFFLPYILTKFANHFGIDWTRKEVIATSAENRIFMSARAVTLIEMKPSIIAAGAILREIDSNLTLEAFKHLPMAEVLDPMELAESYRLLQAIVPKLLPNQEAVGDVDVLKEAADIIEDTSSTGIDKSTSKRKRSEDTCSTDKSTSKREKIDG